MTISASLSRYPKSKSNFIFNLSNTTLKLNNPSRSFANIMTPYTTAATGQLFKYQDSLPSLCVPALNDTLNLYKESLKPLYANGANDEEFIKYSEIIDEFGSSQEGIELQNKLSSFAESKRNWLSEFWDDYAYLEYRDPVSPFVSYFFSHKIIPNSKIEKDQILKSTVLTINILKFIKSIENGSLEPDLIKNNPLCMESFKWMFNNCRVPGSKSDTNLKFDGISNRFMIVISNGYIYKLKTHDENSDEALSFSQIYNSLLKIKSISVSNGPNQNPVGILTSSNRDDWYKNFTKLGSISSKNQSHLNDIFKSSFVLCLDNNAPVTIEDKSKNCWFGDGINRWFDKPVQIFVSQNGNSGFLGEHSKMDGTPTLRLNEWLVKQVSEFEFNEDLINSNDYNYSSTSKLFSQLDFEVSSTIKSNIQNELVKFKNTTNSLDIKTWQYFGFGKEDIKLFKISPDSFVQMLIQLAYFKYTGTLRPTYESASTRKFFKGRTETCRSVSSEALKFVKDWENNSISVDAKLKSFRTAIKSHGNYIKNASLGLGVDRHLFGLKQMIDKSKPSLVVDEFFNNPMFAYSQYWYLSTSQLSSENFNGYGWAPVVPEGLGLAYMINKNWLHINITNFKDNAFGLNVNEMAYYLTLSLNELKEALLKESVAAKL